MPLFSPTDHEWRVLSAAVNGDSVEFALGSSGKPETVIRGEFLRRLLLGLKLPLKPGSIRANRHNLSGSGLRIRGAYFKGVIDLSDCRGDDGNPLVSLLLEDCVLEGEGPAAYANPANRPKPSLDLSHSLLTRLKLKNCEAGFLDLTGANITGDLEFNGLSALTEGGQCRVEAKGLQLGGSFYAPAAKLNLRQAKFEEPDPSFNDYALDLTGANISGSIILEPDLEADGGINLTNAVIGGNCLMDGIQLTAHGGFALICQFAEMGGLVTLGCVRFREPPVEGTRSYQAPTKRAHVWGPISFYGTSLGMLDMSGAQINGNSDNEWSGLICSHMTARQSVLLTWWTGPNDEFPFECDTEVDFMLAKISGGLYAAGAKFSCSSEITGFEGHGMEVMGDFEFSGVQACSISLDRATLSGKVNLDEVRSPLVPGGTKVLAENLRVGSDMHLEHSVFQSITLSGARIEGSLIARKSEFLAPPDTPSFNGTNFEVSKDLSFVDASANKIVLWSARIGRDVLMNKSRLAEFSADDIQIEGCLDWSGILTGRFSLQGSQIGKFYMGNDEGNFLSLVREMGSQPELHFEYMCVKSDLKVKDLRVLQSNQIDLGGYPSIRVLTTRLKCYENWQVKDIFFLTDDETEIRIPAVSVITDGKDKLILLDGRFSIDKVKAEVKRNLTTRDQVIDYLKIYTSHLGKDEHDPLIIVESEEDLGRLIKLDKPGPYGIRPVNAFRKNRYKAWIVYANLFGRQELCRARFRVWSSGEVMLEKQEHITSLKGTPRIYYNSPFRILTGYSDSSDRQNNDQKPSLTPSLNTSVPWSSTPEDETPQFRGNVVKLVDFRESFIPASQKQKTKVSLKGVKIGSLADDHGNSWGSDLRLDLDGLEYERFDEAAMGSRAPLNEKIRRNFDELKGDEKLSKKFTAFVRLLFDIIGSLITKPISKHRIKWLKLQYDKIPPPLKEYKPQPYEQLIKTLRTQGNFDDSIKIMREKFRIERKVRFWRIGFKRMLSWLSDIGFGYGLSPVRAFITFMLFWVVGWTVADLLNNRTLRVFPFGSDSLWVIPGISLDQSVLVQETTPVNTIAILKVPQDRTDDVAAETATLSESGTPIKEIHCGDQIEPALYALDTFVPLLDLRQESKCTISSKPGAWGWRVAKSVYAILGWIVTSALILTISGVVRKRIER